MIGGNLKKSIYCETFNSMVLPRTLNMDVFTQWFEENHAFADRNLFIKKSHAAIFLHFAPQFANKYA